MRTGGCNRVVGRRDDYRFRRTLGKCQQIVGCVMVGLRDQELATVALFNFYDGLTSLVVADDKACALIFD